MGFGRFSPRGFLIFEGRATEFCDLQPTDPAEGLGTR